MYYEYSRSDFYWPDGRPRGRRRGPRARRPCWVRPDDGRGYWCVHSRGKLVPWEHLLDLYFNKT